MNDGKPVVDMPPAPVSAEAAADQGLLLDVEQDRLPLVIIEPGAPSPVEDPDADSVLLELDDLLPDPEGEVVLFTGDDVSVNILTKETITGFGVADEHVTASGVDVTGLNFYSFEGGMTVYSSSDVLIINDPNVS
ncbi:hypothetical protein HBA54_25790 [Pelagibius litoralis]|uniref:Uncharacterized protein n=1 Tax=Pelagibius litoralis TaxID=374515 RepID=A0A967F2K0_9PROT|nr:hypothetical protein [Pelagibius litoralis]NIA72018.1 hypothetical protein [Pelagibius litoralis]